MHSKSLCKQLRIGNYLQGKPVSIPKLGIQSDGTTMITGHGIDVMERGIKTDLSPIPLTKELIAKLGFTFDRFSGYYIELHHANHSKYKGISVSYNNDDHRNQYYVFYREGDSDDRCDDQIVVLRNDLMFVHELQNIYHSITGEELQYS